MPTQRYVADSRIDKFLRTEEKVVHPFVFELDGEAPFSIGDRTWPIMPLNELMVKATVALSYLKRARTCNDSRDRSSIFIHDATSDILTPCVDNLFVCLKWLSFRAR